MGQFDDEIVDLYLFGRAAGERQVIRRYWGVRYGDCQEHMATMRRDLERQFPGRHIILTAQVKVPGSPPAQ